LEISALEQALSKGINMMMSNLKDDDVEAMV